MFLFGTQAAASTKFKLQGLPALIALMEAGMPRLASERNDAKLMLGAARKEETRCEGEKQALEKKLAEFSASCSAA